METIISFTKEGHQMTPIEVEVFLRSGLPKVEFTGLADTSIKESVIRLRTAFEHQGFLWPRKKQIIINLKPAYIKKNSHGLDLAISCALLWKTKQVSPPQNLKSPFYIYGEVGLDGQIEAPRDWYQIDKNSLLTGKIKDYLPSNHLHSAETLKDLKNPQYIPPTSFKDRMKKPPLPSIYFSKKQAELMSLCASGEHSMLLAGPSGSGKTTLARHLECIASPPIEEEFKTSYKISQNFGHHLAWRPLISPHHSTPFLSMIGGGVPPFLGEISRAHSGFLFLDEYLEFHPKVQEALREPIESGKIFISRQGKNVCFPARFILVAATNLCPCGSFVPNKSSGCSYSLRKCRSLLDKLSGPMLDRFDILSFSSSLGESLEVPLDKIDEKVAQAFEFRKKRNQKIPNSRLSLDYFKKEMDPFIFKNVLPSHIHSKRRFTAILRVARTLADLHQKAVIDATDIERSMNFTLKPFNELSQSF